MARGSALGSVSNTYFRFVSESWLSVNRVSVNRRGPDKVLSSFLPIYCIEKRFFTIINTLFSKLGNT
jgi:hypothetical protein